MRAPLGTVALLLFTMAAGCLQAGAPEGLPPLPSDGPPTPTPAPATYTYACPPGPRSNRGTEVCTSQFVDSMNSLDEPYLAIHPADPDVLALAAHSTSALPVGTEPAGADAVRIAVYFSEDGGATWRRTVTPRVDLPSTFGPVDARAYYDPALAFDDEGTLHVAGIASNDLGSYGGSQWDAANVPFHVATTDLGRTWSTPAVLDEHFSDRAFVSAGNGSVYVDWGRYVGSDLVAHVAWSTDGGASWQALETPCRGFSPPVAVFGGAELACVGGDASPPDQASLLRLEAASGTLSPIAVIPGITGYRPRLGLLPGGGRVVVAEDTTIQAVASTDGGATWSAAVDLMPLANLPDGGASWLKWAAPDPWGGVHLEVGEGTDACPGGSRGVPGACVIHHIAFDPSSWDVLAQAVLAPADGAAALHVPGNVPPPQEAALGDDFYAFAFGPDHGILLWTRDGGTEFTHVLPGTP